MLDDEASRTTSRARRDLRPHLRREACARVLQGEVEIVARTDDAPTSRWRSRRRISGRKEESGTTSRKQDTTWSRSTTTSRRSSRLSRRDEPLRQHQSFAPTTSARTSVSHLFLAWVLGGAIPLPPTVCMSSRPTSGRHMCRGDCATDRARRARTMTRPPRPSRRAAALAEGARTGLRVRGAARGVGAMTSSSSASSSVDGAASALPDAGTAYTRRRR